MAQYGYNTYSEMEPRSDGGWSKTSSNHVCRPVIIDAEGRKHPIIRYTGTTTTTTPHNTADGYVAKTETYVERVQSPVNYTREYITSPPMVVLPAEDPYKFKEHQRQNHQTTIHNRPQKVEEFITKVQTEAYHEPTRTSPFSTPYSRPTGYGDHNNNNNGGGHNGYNYHRDEPNYRAGYWSVPPSEAKEIVSTTTTKLTKPTSDINTAIEYLKEVATSPAVAASTQPRFTLGVPPRKSEYSTMDTITSSEAKRRYGSAPSSPFSTGEMDNYTTTIDSREAMKTYNGRIA